MKHEDLLSNLRNLSDADLVMMGDDIMKHDLGGSESPLSQFAKSTFPDTPSTLLVPLIAMYLCKVQGERLRMVLLTPTHKQ